MNPRAIAKLLKILPLIAEKHFPMAKVLTHPEQGGRIKWGPVNVEIVPESVMRAALFDVFPNLKGRIALSQKPRVYSSVSGSNLNPMLAKALSEIAALEGARRPGTITHRMSQHGAKQLSKQQPADIVGESLPMSPREALHLTRIVLQALKNAGR